MKLNTLFEACSLVCDKHIAKNENACVRISDDTLIPYTELKCEIDKVRDWCYPDLATERLKKIVTCKECVHYNMCTTIIPNNPKPQVTHRCRLDNEIKDGNHFCGYAKEKPE